MNVRQVYPAGAVLNEKKEKIERFSPRVDTDNKYKRVRTKKKGVSNDDEVSFVFIFFLFFVSSLRFLTLAGHSAGESDITAVKWQQVVLM